MQGPAFPGGGGHPQNPPPGPGHGPGSGPGHGPGFGGPAGPPPAGRFVPPGRPPAARGGGKGLILVLALLSAVVLLAGLSGTGWYLTRSAGRFRVLPGPCVVLSLEDAQRYVPGGLPHGDFGAKQDGRLLQCRWRPIAGGGEVSTTLSMRLHFYGRSFARGADEAAREGIREDVFGGYGPDPTAGPPRHKATALPGVGDEAYRVEEAFGGEFDSVVFRRSNVVVTVAYEYDSYPGRVAADRPRSFQKSIEVARVVLNTLNAKYAR